jgi:hypothetical protein
LNAIFDGVVRSKPDQSFGLADFDHHIITGINTCSAVHTFELGTIANIYPGWTNIYTDLTVDTISQFFFRRLLFFQVTPWLTSQPVIGNNDRFPG